MADALSLVKRLRSAALDLLYPPRCAVCGRLGALLCDVCRACLHRADQPRCSRCWRPRPEADPCHGCRSAPPSFDGLRSAFIYDRTARSLVHALKYRGMTSLAEPMASLMADAVRGYELAPDIVVPVPLSGMRRRLRGYNQSELLAKALARTLSLPAASGGLTRRRHTPPQARAAGAEERKRNVAGAFACGGGRLEGRRVLLIDDVTTTGATVDACATAIRAAGAEAVWALAFARED